MPFFQEDTHQSQRCSGFEVPIGANLDPSIFQVCSLAEIEGITSLLSADFVSFLGNNLKLLLKKNPTASYKTSILC